MQTTWEFLNTVLGLGVEPKNLTFFQISLRGFSVFAAALVMLRIGDRRALSQKTPFDTVLIVLLAAVLSRAINGSAPFFASIGGSFVIVVLHGILAKVCCRYHAVGRWLKGELYVLVRDGQLCSETMKKKCVTEHDIEEDMRLSAKTEDLIDIKIARLERSGDLSFILKTHNLAKGYSPSPLDERMVHLKLQPTVSPPAIE
jgi:uncharacterized membrane protein YcaP (DUF421 family)